MGIQVVWDNEQKTALRYVFDTRWTWEDFYTAKAQAYSMIDTVNHKIGVIFDAPQGITLPSNMLTHSKSAVNKLHPNTYCVVIVVRNLYLRSMLLMVMRLSRKAAETLTLVSSLDEARALVARRLSEFQVG